jgi:CRISPR-associated protein Csx10
MGQPNLTPKLNDLVDSAKGTLNVHRSFIRAATKSNFNQKRHGLDSDQILIAKGSVLVFDDVNINENQLLQLASQGIGINRQQGLGWIAVNPAWAFKDRYKDDNLYSPITVNNLIEKPNAPVNTTLNSPMINWIAVQVEQKKNTQDTVKSVNSLLVDVVTGYRTARRYNNILNAHEAGPSSSQWRRIADILRFNRSDSFDILFKGEHAICKETNDELGWGIKWDDGTQVISFSAYCENLFKTHSDQVILTFLEKLGRYDLSTYAGLKQACKELNLQLNSTGEGVNA